jgi:hypothetical protein
MKKSYTEGKMALCLHAILANLANEFLVAMALKIL